MVQKYTYTVICWSAVDRAHLPFVLNETTHTIKSEKTKKYLCIISKTKMVSASATNNIVAEK